MEELINISGDYVISTHFISRDFEGVAEVIQQNKNCFFLITSLRI